ncbi:MAG: fumarylacetoacetase [Luteitalea sp.]
MLPAIDHTHDPAARSWLPAGAGPTEAVPTEAGPTEAFPVQNLPFGVFTPAGDDVTPRIGVAIGQQVLDLARCTSAGVCDGLPRPLAEAMCSPQLNALLALTPAHWSALRHRLFALLVDGEDGWRAARESVRAALHPIASVHLHLPCTVGDYTDFYASIHHATNVGTMLRPDQPLLPNYRHLPIGYHGRASSVVVSGTPVRRPSGQNLAAGGDRPVFEPSRRLDYELEVGLVIGGANRLGESVPIAAALDRVFGMVLLNDWSARDVQAWEYQPLGPFLAKSFATSISPWVTTLESLASCRVAAAARGPDGPALLPYLEDADDQAAGAFDVTLDVTLSSRAMRDHRQSPMRVSQSNLRDLYWTPAQLVAHHASNGCNLRPGDLLGTGTVSGPTPESRGCLLERTWRGSEPLQLTSGEQRRFLEDGDVVTLSAQWTSGAGGRFGACAGEVLAARG